jgi:hypothetical protein
MDVENRLVVLRVEGQRTEGGLDRTGEKPLPHLLFVAEVARDGLDRGLDDLAGDVTRGAHLTG